MDSWPSGFIRAYTLTSALASSVANVWRSPCTRAPRARSASMPARRNARITRWRYAEMMFMHSLADFSEAPWAVQVTVAAITVNAQANSSPKRHEPLQGVGTHLLIGHQRGPTPGHHWGLFHGHGQPGITYLSHDLVRFG